MAGRHVQLGEENIRRRHEIISISSGEDRTEPLPRPGGFSTI